MIGGEKIVLRTLEPGDLDYLYRWENDPEVWSFGDCGAVTPARSCAPVHVPIHGEAFVLRYPSERFSRDELCDFIENQQYGISANRQLRLVICRRGVVDAEPAPVGFIDLFDFDSEKFSAGVGILICDPADRNQGYGSESLRLIWEWARRELGLREAWCTVAADNTASLALFTGAGFVSAESCSGEGGGTKKLLTFVKS